MGGSNTGRTNQVNTTEIHSAVNNQDLSKDIKINDTKNIRNYDIVHGNDIKGGHNTFNAVLNTSTGKQIFKLQELDNFTFTPDLSGSAHLESGEIINGTAGQVDIKGDGNKFIQGTSSSNATSSGGGAAGATSSSGGGDDRAAAAALKAKMQGRLQELNFTFAPNMSGTSNLQSGEIINGTAGQVTI